MKKTIFTEFKAIFNLAFPLIMNLLSYMAMQFVDTVMLGRLGPLALASSALGNVVFIIILVGCIGTLTAVGTLSGQAFGDEAHHEIKMITQQGLWLSIFLCIPSLWLIWNAHYFLLAIKQSPPIVWGAKDFLHGLFWGFLPDLFFITLREFTTAISRPRIVMIIAFIAIPLNAILNYWFMYGGFGLPAMKIFGVGLATSLVSWLMVIALSIYILSHKITSSYHLFHWNSPRWDYLRRIFALGFPVGISFMVEEFLFVITALLIGYFGVDSLAAHQIAIQCLFMFIMIPIAISQATAVRVSQLLGARKKNESFRSAYISISSGMLIALIVSCFLWAIPSFFVSIFIDIHAAQNLPVVVLAEKIIAIIAFFHVIDAGQLITNGALRGYQDTVAPMFLGVISFWFVGIGSGYLLGFVYGYGVVGLWTGLAFGITTSAILLQLRLLTHKAH